MSRRINCTLIAAFVLLLHILPAHSQIVSQQSTKAQVEANWKTAGWSIPAGWTPVTSEAEAKSWADQLSKVIESKDSSAFIDGLFEMDQLFDDSIGEIPEGSFKSGIQRGINDSLKASLKAMIDGGDFSVRRTRNTKYGPVVLTRLLSTDGTVAYVLWRLIKNNKGAVKAVDFLSLGTGEWTSHTLARAAIINMPKEASFLQKLGGKQLEYSKGQEQFLELAKAQQAKDYKKVLERYKSLPASLKKEKFIQMVRLNAAMQVDNDEYVLAVGEFKQAHPNDLASELHSIDFYFLKKDFAAMRNSIDSIISKVGPDSHLYGLKAVGYSSEEKHAEAANTLLLAIKTEPNREDNYWSLIETALSAKDFKTVGAVLKSLVDRFDYKEFNFEEVDIYKPFLGSPEHKDFLEFLKKRTK